MLSKITLIGNLGRDPETRQVGDTTVTNFSVAANRSYTNSQGVKVKETTWLNISAWGRLGEVCAQYLHQGSLVYVEGRLTPDKDSGNPRTFTRQDGSVGASYELRAEEVKFLDRAPNTGNGNGNGQYQAAPVVEDDDIPF